jgi:two-component system, LytTR family, response regulator LytT
MEVLIVEDEGHTARRLESLLKEIDPNITILNKLDSISSAVDWFKGTTQLPDLVFMDIRLADGLSFEIFSQVSIKQPVVFTTAYDEYTLKAFKVNSIDYLLKPIEKDALEGSLRKFQELKQTPHDISKVIQQLVQQKNYRSRFLVATRDGFASVFADDIAYFYSSQRITHLVTKDNRLFTLDDTLEELEQQLDPKYFFRANRQFILQHKSIISIKNYFNGKLKVLTTPPGKEDIIVSRDKATGFKAWMDN